MNKVLKADLEDIVSSSSIDWRKLSGSTVLITGATGSIGGAITRAMAAADEHHTLNMRIIACGRNMKKCELLAAEYGVEVICGDICDPGLFAGLAGDAFYIFHCAAITKSKDMAAKPADVMSVSAGGTQNMLELARRIDCKGFVYLSSMEVYGQGLGGDTDETMLGYIDLLNPRSCYPESKRFCETLCAAYHAQYGVPVKIARLAQTFGAGTPKDDTRVFAQIARSVVGGQNIVLHTEGKSRGNYCYTSDAVRGLLSILLKGKSGEAYNIANPAASATIREMAELAAREIGGSRVKVVFDIPEDLSIHGYAPTVGYRLNADKLMSLGWFPKYGLYCMYRRMIDDWEE